jgi:predicted nucleic acid-binding protein
LKPRSATGRGGVFLDTSGLYEAFDRSASRHDEVAVELERLMRDNRPLVTIDAVITEFHGLTLGRLGPEIALDAVGRLLTSPRVRVLATGPGAIRSAVDYLRSRPARRLSLTDALSFSTMRDQGIGTALALDTDFAAEGFAIVP